MTDFSDCTKDELLSRFLALEPRAASDADIALLTELAAELQRKGHHVVAPLGVTARAPHLKG